MLGGYGTYGGYDYEDYSNYKKINYEEKMVYYFNEFIEIISNEYNRISVKDMFLIKEITINYIKEFDIIGLREYYEKKLSVIANYIDWRELKDLILVQLSLIEKSKNLNIENNSDLLLKICENIPYHEYLSLNKALNNNSYNDFSRIYLRIFDLTNFERNLKIQLERKKKFKRIGL